MTESDHEDIDALENENKHLRARVHVLASALRSIGFTPEGQPVVGTSNRSAKANFERVTAIARKALQTTDDKEPK